MLSVEALFFIEMDMLAMVLGTEEKLSLMYDGTNISSQVDETISDNNLRACFDNKSTAIYNNTRNSSTYDLIKRISISATICTVRITF